MKCLLAVIAAVSLLLAVGCGGDGEEVVRSAGSEIDMILAGECGPNPFLLHYGSMPPGGKKMKINSVGGNLGRVFNDSNYRHLEAAEAIGVKPIVSLASA